MGQSEAAALLARRPTITTLHVGGGRNLVDEHDSLGVKVELRLEAHSAMAAITRSRGSSDKAGRRRKDEIMLVPAQLKRRRA
jgi:hypothetical protein